MSETNGARRGGLKGKVAVITGAARGIGRAAALALANEGADIAGIDICASVYPASGVKPATKQDLEETGGLVQATGVRWLGLVAHQRDTPALRRAAESIAKELGGIDILFANGGVQGFRALLEMEDEDWDIHIETNLTGTAKVVRAFAPHLIKRGSGRIIVTSSTQGTHGMKYGSAYSASKWGIIGLMKSAALEFAEYGVTVNALIPGLIETPLTMHEERFAQAIEEAGHKPAGRLKEDQETARKIMEKAVPLGVAFIAPKDVAPVVAFLASEEARMVTGAAYEVNGGASARNAV